MAVTTVGEMEIRLNAAVGQFEQKMNQAAGTISKIGKVALGIGGAIAGAFAVRAVAGFAAKISDAADANVKHARALGMSIEGLIELQHVAELDGISIEQLSVNMDALYKRLGKGVGISALEKLGLDAQRLQTMGIDKGISAIGAAASKIKDPFERAAIATDLFGRAGMGMLQLVSKMTGEARELGTSMTEIDVQKLEAVNDNFTRLRVAVKGAAQSILVELAPAVEKITNTLVDAAKGLVALVRGAELTGGELARTDAWGEYYRAVDRAISMERRGLIDLEERQRRVTKALEDRITATNRLKPTFGEVFAELSSELDTVAEDVEKKFGMPDFAVERKKLEGLFELGKITEPAYKGALEDLEKKDPAMRAAAEFWNMIQDKMRAAADSVRSDADSIAQSVKTPMELFRDQMAKIGELFSLGAIDRETAMRAEMKAREELYGTSTTAGNVLGGAGDFGAQFAISELKRRGVERDKQEAMLREAQKQSRYLGTIADNTGRDVVPVYG